MSAHRHQLRQLALGGVAHQLSAGANHPCRRYRSSLLGYVRCRACGSITYASCPFGSAAEGPIPVVVRFSSPSQPRSSPRSHWCPPRRSWPSLSHRSSSGVRLMRIFVGAGEPTDAGEPVWRELEPSDVDDPVKELSGSSRAIAVCWACPPERRSVQGGFTAAS